MRFYGYAGCGTCKKAKKWLEERGIPFEEIAIREQPPTKAELEQLVALTGDVRRLLNTSGKDYRALGGKTYFANLSVDETLDLLRQNGNLIKRPFVVAKDNGAVGFAPEVWVEKFAAR